MHLNVSWLRLFVSLAVLVLVCASLVSANTLLLNHGELSSTIGPDPTSYGTLSNLLDAGGYDLNCLYTHTGYSCSFASSAYKANRGRISFWYKPAQTTGNVIFTIGDPVNNAYLVFYQNWTGKPYPTVAARVGGVNWGYQVHSTNTSWTWDTTRWYFFTIVYKMTGSATDYIDFYIDGVLQTGYAQGRNSPIDPLPGTQSILFGSSGAAYMSAARFDDIRIIDSDVGTQPVDALGQLKILGDNVAVSISGMVATSAADDFAGYCYIEQPDRVSGVRVVSPALPLDMQIGSVVDLIGVTSTNASGERQIASANVTVTGSQAPLLELGMKNRDVGGGTVGIPPLGQYGMSGATGANNIGLLVKVWGRVSATAAGYVAIDDGSGTAVMIDTSKLGTSVPTPSDFVAVTGISSIYLNGSTRQRLVLPRNSTDVVPISHPRRR